MCNLFELENCAKELEKKIKIRKMIYLIQDVRNGFKDLFADYCWCIFKVRLFEQLQKPKKSF